MSSCEHYQELISRLVDDELSAEEQAVLVSHLEHCPDCAALVQAFQSISAVIAEDLAEPPEALSENVMAELRREAIKTENRKKRRWKGPLATAACLAVVIAAAWLIPNMFRANSAAPSEAPALASDQAVPQARGYGLENGDEAQQAAYHTCKAADQGKAAGTGLAPQQHAHHDYSGDGEGHLPGGGKVIAAGDRGGSAQGGEVPGQHRGAAVDRDKIIGRAPDSADDM